jgi:hypothetical protein
MKELRSQFRIPHELAEQLKSAATESHRSLNAEIVGRLSASFSENSDQLDRIERAVDQIKAKVCG